MHSKNTKEMKMLFENWRSHNNVIAESDGEEEMMRRHRESVGGAPAGGTTKTKTKSDKMTDLAADIFDIMKDFSNDIRAGGAFTFILENDGGIQEDLFIKTKNGIWKLSSTSDFPTMVRKAALGSNPIFHVPSSTLKTLKRSEPDPEGVGPEPSTPKPSTGTEHVPELQPGGDLLFETNPMGYDRGRPGYHIGALVEQLNEASAIDNKVIQAGEELAKSIDEIEELADAAAREWPAGVEDFDVPGGQHWPRTPAFTKFKRAFSQFRKRYTTIIGLRQQWFNVVNKFKKTYEALFGAEAKLARRIAKAKRVGRRGAFGSESWLFGGKTGGGRTLEQLKNALDKEAIVYSRSVNAIVDASEATVLERLARRREVSFGFGEIRIPFSNWKIFGGDGSFRYLGEFLKLRWLKPYSQVRINPELLDMDCSGGVCVDKLSDRARTRLHGEENLALANRMDSEAKHLDRLKEDAKVKLSNTLDADERKILEVEIETRGMAAEIYRNVAAKVRKLHEYAPRGARIGDTLKLVKGFFKVAFLTAFIKMPKSIKGKVGVSLLRAAAIIFAATFAWDTFAEFYEQFKTYVGHHAALTLIWMIESDIGIELVWGISLGDTFLEVLAEINKSAIEKIAAAGGDYDAADLNIMERGVYYNVQVRHGEEPTSRPLPHLPSLRSIYRGGSEGRGAENEPVAPPGAWGDLLFEDKDPKSLKIVLG